MAHVGNNAPAASGILCGSGEIINNITMVNQYNIIIGIISYLFCIKTYSMIFSMIEYIGVTNVFNHNWYYLIILLLNIICLFLLKFIFHFQLKKGDNIYSVYLFSFLLLVFVWFEQMINYRLGLIIGESISDIKELLSIQKIEGYGYILLHIMILFFYEYIFINLTVSSASSNN